MEKDAETLETLHDAENNRVAHGQSEISSFPDVLRENGRC